MAMIGRNSAESAIRDEVAALKASLAALADKVSDYAEEGTERSMRKAEEGYAGLTGLLDDWLGTGRREAKRALNRTAKTAEAGLEEMHGHVGRHPIAAIGIAALVGFALGLAASGGRR